MTSYAIDFGTSNTVITRWNEEKKKPEIIKLSDFCITTPPNLSGIIPSLLYVKNADDRQFIIGQQVRDKGLDLSNSKRSFRNFKRGIGAELQGFLPELDGQLITFDRVGKWYLQELINKIQTQDKIDSLVLTVPVDSFEVYRLWLLEICQSLNIDRVRILDEPTAAALGYGTADKELLLVVDFGGGTVDFSLIELAENKNSDRGYILKWGQNLLGENKRQRKTIARVLAKAGKNLGGSDIDNWLVDYFRKTQNLPQSSLVTRLTEKLKIKLSDSPEATEAYFNDETLETYDLNLNQELFSNILEENQFFTQLEDLMSQVLQQGRRNGIEVSDINTVLLVGGTVQIPALQNWIKQYFPNTLLKSDRPLSAIAEGALKVAKGIEVKDFLYHSYGIRYWNRQEKRHSWHPIIKTGQPYPMVEPVELFLGASTANQQYIELIIGELGDETSGTEVYFDGDRLITRNITSKAVNVKPLNDKEGARNLAKLEPPGSPGSDRVRLQFTIDNKCCLCLSVEDLLTQEILLDSQIIAQLK